MMTILYRTMQCDATHAMQRKTILYQNTDTYRHAMMHGGVTHIYMCICIHIDLPSARKRAVSPGGFHGNLGNPHKGDQGDLVSQTQSSTVHTTLIGVISLPGNLPVYSTLASSSAKNQQESSTCFMQSSRHMGKSRESGHL